MRRSVFVFFSYSFMAATNMVRKLEEDVEGEGDWNIVARQLVEGRADTVYGTVVFKSTTRT